MMNRGKTRAAVVVPASSREQLLPEEVISLRHLSHFLGHYDSYFVIPRGSPLCWPGLTRVEVSRRYFGNARAHSRMMMARDFYELFSKYEFVLIYHLDALVLSDQLEDWCDVGYDYIGAPLYRGRVGGKLPLSLDLARAGNGGFSLRRVSAMLRVLTSRVPQLDVRSHWQTRYGASWQSKVVGMVRTVPKVLPLFNSVRWEVSRYPVNEDVFWSDRASHYAPLRIAPVREALRFAFSREPRYCLEESGGELPFGVHAWYRHERSLWEPYLLPEADAVAGPVESGDAYSGQTVKAQSG